MQDNPIQQVGDNTMKKCFWIIAAVIFLFFGQSARVAAQAPERRHTPPKPSRPTSATPLRKKKKFP